MEKKRKGSRTYQTFTFHYQRVPRVEVKGKGVTYRGAQEFLDKWEKLYRDYPAFKDNTEITRTRSRVEVHSGKELVVAAYFEEEK